MKKFVTLSLLTLLFTSGAHAQLLYKISGKGLQKESYIVGTYHLAPASFVDDIEGATEALQSVDAVCGELIMDEMTGNDATKALNEAMILPEGHYINDILTEEQMESLNGYMRGVLGTDFNNPQCKLLMGRYRPSALVMQLELMSYMKMTPDFNPLKLIDDHFQREAKRMGKRVLGLETVEFQIATLFDAVPIEREVEQLMMLVENPTKSHEAMQALADAYFSKDIEAIERCMLSSVESGETTPEEWERICTSRNHNWVEQMPTIMTEGSTLFVVGAAHLVGDEGVVALLRKAGYKVRAVK